MSMPFSVITCDSCSREWFTHVFWGRHSYRLPDGRNTEVHQALAWCTPCNNFVMMEQFPKPERVQEKLMAAARDLEARQVIKEHVLFGFIKRKIRPKPEDLEPYQRRLQEVEALRDWCRVRTSPLKCLTCGSTDVQKIDLRGDQPQDVMRHPHCGGTFQVEESEICISKRLKHRFYDIEGHFLSEEDGR